MRKTYKSEQTQEKFTGRKDTNLILNVDFELAFASAHFSWNAPKMSEICFSNRKTHLKGPRRHDQSILALMASDITISVVCFSSLPFMTNFCQAFLGITPRGNVPSDRSLQRNAL